MATVQITIVNDDGTAADSSLTTLPAGVLDLARNAMAATYGYQATIPNPSFNPSEPAGPSNPQTIPNPVSLTRFMTLQWRALTTQIVEAYAVKQASEQAAIQAAATVQSQAASITVQ